MYIYIYDFISLDFTWFHLVSLGFTWFHLVSLGVTWVSRVIARLHVWSLSFTWCSRKGKGKAAAIKREKGKTRDEFLPRI